MRDVTIFSNSAEIGDEHERGTGYCVEQAKTHTRVWHKATGREIALPHKRYALSCDEPLSGRPGRAQFAADFYAAPGI